MANADFNKGYADAVKALKQMMSGKSQGDGTGSGIQKGMEQPQLNDADAKKAAANAKRMKNGVQKSARQEAKDASTNAGGFMSQSAAIDIARQAGYGDEYLEEKGDSALEHEWQETAIKACSRSNGPGIGKIITKIKDLYLTKHDWKGELKKYIGKALSKRDNDRKLGNKKYLAQGELRYRSRHSSDRLSDIIFLIDCSGSISDDLLANLLRECYSIVVKKEIEEVTYAYYDDGIRQIETTKRMKDAGVIPPEMITRLRNAKKVSGNVHGRGGNDEAKTMADLLQLLGRDDAELVMWFTDGITASVPVRDKKHIKNMIWVVYDNTEFTASDDTRVIHIASSDLAKR